MTARRGSALIMTITLMIFFAILCGAVIGMAQMNVTYHSFFEHRGILKQATLTFAESMAENVREKADVWWPGGSNALGSGDYVLTPTPGQDDFLLQMKFEYFISPDRNDVYMLVVSGEYTTPRRNDVGWNVSVDIHEDPLDDIWTTIAPYAIEGS
ncbi:MAG: hypothetical protein LBR71_05430 [Synergistaceae bacterium]|jgi:hypothetical protein|nr:hypothetical protein [Synergistaceae bacterium]